MGLFGAIWRYFIKPVGIFFFAVSAFATAFNEIETTRETLTEWGWLDRCLEFAGSVAKTVSANWLLTIVCAALVVFMYYLLILEPYLYARRQEQEILERRDRDE